MNELTADRLTSAGIDTFLTWLNGEYGYHYAPEAASDPALATDDGRTLAITVRPLYEPDADPAWSRRRDAVAAQLREAGAGPLTLWVPPETDLPHGDRTEFVQRVAEAAATLNPGERGQVEFPVTLTLKKLSTEASYVHVSGGLAPHWAKLTGRAYGQYELDAKPIHRLPEPESRVNDLLEWVALLGNGMKVGGSSDIKAEDAWTIQRPAFGQATAIVGAAPDTDPSNGTAVRRRLRTALRETAPMLAADGEAKALVLAGIYRTIAEENALIALRGCDPALYSGFDTICLVADGHCRLLYGPRIGAVVGR